MPQAGETPGFLWSWVLLTASPAGRLAQSTPSNAIPTTHRAPKEVQYHCCYWRGNFLTTLSCERWFQKEKNLTKLSNCNPHTYKKHSVPLSRKRNVLVIRNSARLSQISAQNSMNLRSNCQDSTETSTVSVCTDAGVRG